MIGFLGLGLLIFFDLEPPAAYDDDWVYSWSVRQLATGKGFRNLPQYGVLHAPQTILSFALTLGHDDIRLLRLTVVPFLLFASLAMYRLSRQLGADRFWSAVTAAAPLATPVALSVATAFMTEYIYLAFLIGAAYFASSWVRHGEGGVLCIALTALAALERPQGLLIAPALTVAIVWSRGRALTTWDRRGLAALWLTAVSAGAGPIILDPARYLSHTSVGTGAGIWNLALPSVGIPVMFFSLGAPFVLAGTLAGSRLRWGGARLARTLFVPATVLWMFLSAVGVVFVRNVWQLGSLGPVTLGGGKPPLLATRLGLMAVTAATLLFPLVVSFRATRRREARQGFLVRWKSVRQAPGEVVLLVMLATGHVAAMSFADIFDRYYLEVVFPALPLIAVAATRAGVGRPERIWAIGAMAAGLVVYAIGQQDYAAWQGAREAAINLVPTSVSRLDVSAGYEANAVHGLLPYYEANGNYPEDAQGRGALIRYLLDGPKHPAYSLCFAPTGESGAGVHYQSMAPGKIVVLARKRCT